VRATLRTSALGGAALALAAAGFATWPGPARGEAGASWTLGPFTRDAAPVLGPDPQPVFRCPVRNEEVRWQERAAFNPAAVVRDGRVHLLFRAEDGSGEAGGTSRIGLAVSEDGRRFERQAEPVLYPADDFMMPYEWEGGCEDPRVVEREDGTYVMTYTAFDGTTARLAVATSGDLVHWTKHGLAFGKAADGRFRDLWSKSGALVCSLSTSGRLVATRIAGKYWMYWGESEVFTATSDNLVDWTPTEREDVLVKRVTRQRAGKPTVEVPGTRTSFKVVIAPRQGRFDSALVAPGPPPVLTARGILLLYNGSNSRASGDPTLPVAACAGGQVLLDPLDPTAVLARAEATFFRPDPSIAPRGEADGFSFLEALAFFRGRWLLYYGVAGSRIGVAEYTPP